MSSNEFVSLYSLSNYVKIEVKEEKCTFLATGKARNGKYFKK